MLSHNLPPVVSAFARRKIVWGLLAIGLTIAAGASAQTESGQEPIDLAQYRGKVVYLDFWASWCAPCAESFPYMERLKQDFSKDELVIVAVNVDHAKPRADAFLKRMNSDLHVVFDPEGLLASAFKVKAMPTSLLIGKDGRIRYVHSGFHADDIAKYDDHLRELLDEK
ncbi:MAG: TlpA disulfide reductase family protein [Parvularculaceae bacterium]